MDTTAWENLLKSKGYPVFDSVKEALKRFGGLRINNPMYTPPGPEDWHFDIEETVENAIPEKVRHYYSNRLGRPLCVIGEAFQGCFLLMMDEAGHVYGAYDEQFFLIGESIFEAIEALATGRALIPVPET